MENKNQINWRSLTTNRKYMLFSIGAILISILIIFYGIIPQIATAKNLYQQAEKKKQKLSALQQKAADLESIEAREAFSSKEIVDKILPSRKPLIELLTALNTVATTNNIKFVNFSLTPGEISSKSAEFLDSAKLSTGKKGNSRKKSDYQNLQVELTIEGEFKEVQNFFADIERVAPLTTIASIALNIKSQGNIEDTDLVEADLLLNGHFFTKALSVALESPLPDIGARDLEIVDEITTYTIPTVADQTRVIGGGVEDLFGFSFEQIEKLNNEQNLPKLPTNQSNLPDLATESASSSF
jgi:Tfp pilus assembly protein PilO